MSLTESYIDTIVCNERNFNSIILSIGKEEYNYIKENGNVEIIYEEGKISNFFKRIKEAILSAWNRIKEMFKKTEKITSDIAQNATQVIQNGVGRKLEKKDVIYALNNYSSGIVLKDVYCVRIDDIAQESIDMPRKLVKYVVKKSNTFKDAIYKLKDQKKDFFRKTSYGIATSFIIPKDEDNNDVNPESDAMSIMCSKRGIQFSRDEFNEFCEELFGIDKVGNYRPAKSDIQCYITFMSSNNALRLSHAFFKRNFKECENLIRKVIKANSDIETFIVNNKIDEYEYKHLYHVQELAYSSIKVLSQFETIFMRAFTYSQKLYRDIVFKCIRLANQDGYFKTEAPIAAEA